MKITIMEAPQGTVAVFDTGSDKYTCLVERVINADEAFARSCVAYLKTKFAAPEPFIETTTNWNKYQRGDGEIDLFKLLEDARYYLGHH